MERLLDPLDVSQRCSYDPFMAHSLKYLEMQNLNPGVLFGDLRRQFVISDVLKSFHPGRKSNLKKLPYHRPSRVFFFSKKECTCLEKL